MADINSSAFDQTSARRRFTNEMGMKLKDHQASRQLLYKCHGKIGRKPTDSPILARIELAGSGIYCSRTVFCFHHMAADGACSTPLVNIILP